MGRGKHFEASAAIVQSLLVDSTYPQSVNAVLSVGVLLDSSLMLTTRISASLHFPID